jgi:hypothetical protein
MINMKKILFVLMIMSSALCSKAAVKFNADTIKTDTVKPTKEILALQVKLTKLNGQLKEVQDKIPGDEEKVKTTQDKAHDAQVDSKKASDKAVGGDAGDVKEAEKAAKSSSNATDDLQDANKQLERDHKKVKSLT